MSQARSNDVIPDGGIVPLADLDLSGGSGSITLAPASGRPAVLNCQGSAAWRASTVAPNPATGVLHAANVEVYLPVMNQTVIYFSGSGTLQMTLLVARDQ